MKIEFPEDVPEDRRKEIQDALDQAQKAGCEITGATYASTPQDMMVKLLEWKPDAVVGVRANEKGELEVSVAPLTEACNKSPEVNAFLVDAIGNGRGDAVEKLSTLIAHIVVALEQEMDHSDILANIYKTIGGNVKDAYAATKDYPKGKMH